jgi:hypothetical protein
MAKAIPPPMAAFPLLTDPFILAAVALLVVAPPVFLFLRAANRGCPVSGTSRS